MALSIKTDEADRLARELASLTGRSMTAVVTEALAEKLERERAKTSAAPIDRAALNEVLTRLRRGLDRRPVTKQEMDNLWGEGEDA